MAAYSTRVAVVQEQFAIAGGKHVNAVSRHRNALFISYSYVIMFPTWKWIFVPRVGTNKRLFVPT